MTEVIKDALYVNKIAAKRTFSSFKYIPFVVISLAIYYLGQYLMSYLNVYLLRIIRIPYLIGIFNYIVEIAGMSLVMSVLYSVIVGDRLNVKNFASGWKTFIGPLINTRFIIFLAELLLGRVFATSYSLLLVWNILLAIILSPMLETIYIGRNQGIDAIMDMFAFIKTNFLQWLPVLIVFSLLNTSSSLMTINTFGNNILYILLDIVLLSITYIYKGHLYSILYNSSVRKRKFQGVFE